PNHGNAGGVDTVLLLSGSQRPLGYGSRTPNVAGLPAAAAIGKSDRRAGAVDRADVAHDVRRASSAGDVRAAVPRAPSEYLGGGRHARGAAPGDQRSAPSARGADPTVRGPGHSAPARVI